MQKSSVKYQYYATLFANLLSLSYGGTCGWPSSSLLLLQSEESPLDSGPISSYEASWIGSIMCIGGLIGNFLFAWLSDKYGRKLSMLFAAFPQLLSWLIIPFAANVFHLCIARFLGGFAAGGVFSIIPVYVTEISEDKVRGSLGSCLVLSCNIGILLAFILGAYLPYSVVPYIFAAFTLVFIIGCIFLPETPHQLMKMKKETEALKSLRYFRNIDAISTPSSIFLAEIEKLRGEYLKDDKNLGQDNRPLSWNDFSNRVAIKAFAIGAALMALNQFCGCFAMINYTASIFQKSGSNLSPNMSAIIVGAIQIIGAYISTMLVERCGRKVLLVFSAIGTGIGLLCLGLYVSLDFMGLDVSEFQWVPVTSFSFTILVANLAVLTLPFLVVSEIMPLKIRTIGCMVCMSLLWIFAFSMIKFLPYFNDVLGMHGTMFSFSSCCFAGAAFVLIYVPETKGRSIEVILASM